MKVIAMKEGEDIYLIDEEQDDQGFVFDQGEGVRYPPHYKESILLRGYWIGIENDPRILKEAIKAKEVVIE